MYKFAVLDDDIEFATRLKEKVECLWDEVEITLYHDLSVLDTLDYQALFLDIELDDLGQTGFEIANTVKERCDIPIIFITSHKDYALDGYRYMPFGFVWKAQLSQRLPGIVRNLQEYVEQESLLLRVQNDTGFKHPIQISKIRYFRKDRNYVIIKADDEYRIRGSVRSLLTELSSKGLTNFFVPLNGYVVNIDYIQDVDKKNLVIILDNQDQVPIGQKHVRELLVRMCEKYL